MFFRNRKVAATMTLIALTSAGCAPQFIDIKSPPPKLAWVERKAIATSDQIAPVESMEFVLSSPTAVVIGPDERVRWKAGIDLANSKLQRGIQNGVNLNANMFRGNEPDERLIRSYTFQINGDQLSVEGQLALERFKAQSTSRFYVEFLNSGAMTESTVNDTLTAWKALSMKLKEKGLNTSSVVLGGGKFEQQMNAIVLVKVGK